MKTPDLIWSQLGGPAEAIPSSLHVPECDTLSQQHWLSRGWVKTVSLKEAMVTKIFGHLCLPLRCPRSQSCRNAVKVHGFLQGQPESLLGMACPANAETGPKTGVL